MCTINVSWNNEVMDRNIVGQSEEALPTQDVIGSYARVCPIRVG